jgi:hypothetical protein
MSKQYLPKLKSFVSNTTQWSAFEEALDFAVEMQVKKLEQSTDPIHIYHAQGAITALRQLKHLKDEVNNVKTTNN